MTFSYPFDVRGVPTAARRFARLCVLVIGAALTSAAVEAQEAQDTRAAAEPAFDQHLPSVWDLELGTHARLLPADDFIDFACGTNGGPPSRPLSGWTDYASCTAEESGLHEVYFEYDDEEEYRGRARNLELQVMRHEYTRVNGVPVIASALFDKDGFLVGLRLVTDPRVPVEMREKGMILGGFLFARYGEDGWSCTDLPRAPGESEFKGIFVKRECERTAELESGLPVELSVLVHNLRGKGETIIGWDNVPTEGAFESSTRFDMLLAAQLPDRAERLAEVAALGPPEPDPEVLQALDCPGCDLSGIDLKRADLTGANLAGANLAGANLHAAVLQKANLAGANLAGANLNRADLRAADLTGADLQKAMLFGGSLDGARLTEANLNGALAGRSRFIRADLTGASMRAVDLRHGRLNDAVLAGVDLSSSWVSDAQLTRADLTDAILIYVRAIRANLSSAKLAGVDARGADFFGASLYNADLAGADFSYTRLSQVNLWSAKLTGTLFEEAELPAGFEQPAM